MTAPIYEPSEQKQIAALGYDKNQLQRRPAPVPEPGTATYPYFRARRMEGTIEVTSGVNFNLCWDNWELCPDDDSIFSWTAADLGASGDCLNNLIRIRLMATGVYAIHAQIDYEEDLTFDTAIGMYDGVVSNSKMWVSLADWLNVGTAGPSLLIQAVRAYHVDDQAKISIETIQNSGSAKFIGAEDGLQSNYFQIFYLGNYECVDCDPPVVPTPYIGGGGSCGPGS